MERVRWFVPGLKEAKAGCQNSSRNGISWTGKAPIEGALRGVCGVLVGWSWERVKGLFVCPERLGRSLKTSMEPRRLWIRAEQTDQQP